MSGGPGGGVPQCVEGPGSWRDAFMEPKENSTFHVGDKVAMDWFTGQVPYSGGNQPAMAVTVTMRGTSGAPDVTILDSVVSVYQFRKVDSSPYWTNIDACGYTHMAWTWPIPESFTVTDGAQYWLTATNVTLFDNVSNGTVMASSDKFNILPSNLTTTTTTTTATTSSATPGPTDSRPPAQDPTTGTGLSAGAKGGIAVGVVLGVALLALIGRFIWRRKQAGETSTAGERFEKAELGAEAEIPPKEAGGTEILEMDAVGAQTRQVPQQLELAELHGDTTHPLRGDHLAEQGTRQNLVARYSGCARSYKSDKLHAIRGLQMLSGERDGKRYSRGLCLAADASIADLLWFGEERLVRDVPGVESWSWASMTGQVSFKSAVFDESTTPNATCGGEEDGRLSVGGHVKEVGDLRGPLRCQAFCYEDLQDMDFSGRMRDDYRVGSIHVTPAFLLLAEWGAKVGWGVFDEYKRPMVRVSWLALLHQRVWKGFGNSKEQGFEWCLLLQACDDAGNDWKRVGWGIVLDPGWIGVSDPAKPNFRRLILL